MRDNKSESTNEHLYAIKSPDVGQKKVLNSAVGHVEAWRDCILRYDCHMPPVISRVQL